MPTIAQRRRLGDRRALQKAASAAVGGVGGVGGVFDPAGLDSALISTGRDGTVDHRNNNDCNPAVYYKSTIATDGDRHNQQPGRSYLFDGVNDYVDIGNTSASVTYLKFRVKLVVDNQGLFTLQNSTTTAVTVVSGVLTFGGSLTVSEIKVDDAVKTASEAGALLNDNGWHDVEVTLSSIAVSNLRIGTNSSGYGNFYLGGFWLSSDGADGLWKCDEGGGITAFDSSGNGNDGTVENVASLSTFHDEGTNTVYSWQNRVGYSESWGADTSGELASFSTDIDLAATTTADFSFEFEYKFTGDVYLLRGNPTVFYVRRLGDDRVRLGMGGGIIDSTISSGTVTDGSWHKYRIVRTDELVDIFMDDVEVASGQTFERAQTGISQLGNGHSGNQVRNVKFNDTYIYPCDGSGRDSGVNGNTWILPSTVFELTVIPRDESNTTNDVLGQPLQYSGPVPRDVKLKDMPCWTGDGVDDYATGGDHGISDYPFSICGWINLAANSRDTAICLTRASSPNSYFGIGHDTDGQLRFRRRNSTQYNTKTGYSISLSTWYHVVAIFETDTTLRMYVNGEHVFYSDSESSLAFDSDQFAIGVTSTVSPTDYWEGSIADVHLYDRVLTASEVQTVFRGGVAANPVRHYPCIENGGSTLHDLSDNAQHAVMSSGTVLATAWAATQDKYDYLVSNGWSGTTAPYDPTGSDIPAGSIPDSYTVDESGGVATPVADALNLGEVSPPDFDTLDAVSPADTKFGRDQDGYGDRLFVSEEALTGEAKADTLSYVGQ